MVRSRTCDGEECADVEAVVAQHSAWPHRPELYRGLHPQQNPSAPAMSFFPEICSAILNTQPDLLPGSLSTHILWGVSVVECATELPSDEDVHIIRGLLFSWAKCLGKVGREGEHLCSVMQGCRAEAKS